MIGLTMELTCLLNSIGFVLAKDELFFKNTLVAIPTCLFKLASFPVASKCGGSLA